MSVDAASGRLWWLVVLAAAAGTMAIRLSFIEAFSRVESLPPRVERVLRYVPPAVLAALVAPAFLVPAAGGPPTVSPRLVAGIVAAAVAWYTESTLLTLAAGMAMIWAVELLA